MLEQSSISVEYDLLSTTLPMPQTAVFDLCNEKDQSRCAFETEDFTLLYSSDGECVRLRIVPKRRLFLHKCMLEYSFVPMKDMRYLLNGYQSWTDTAELTQYSIMRGLDNTPRQLVNSYSLDGSGDYGFADYSITPGTFHGWTYGYLKDSEACELIGSLNESNGFLHIGIVAPKGKLTLSPECPMNALEAGSETELCSFALIQAGTVEQCFDRWFSLSGISPRTKSPLIGYTSWYRHYDDINAECLEADLAAAKTAFEDIDTSGFNVAFQIDDGFAKVGDWLDPRKDRFPNGMGILAKEIAAEEFIPGLWLAPFVCEADSELAKMHPDWILRDNLGKEVRTGSHWSGGLALDILNPEVEDYVKEVITTVTRIWGFRLLKLDFLYAACIVPHDGLNRGQIMHRAMQILRDSAGDDTLLLGCGVPLAPAFGVVDYCRIGCDVGPDWDGQFYMRPLHRERVSTKRSLSNTVYRSQLNGRAFLNDPDVIFLRDDVKLSSDQKKLLLDGACSLAGVVMCSDDMAAWSPDALSLYKVALLNLRETNR